MQYQTIGKAIRALYDLGNANRIEVNGELATVEDVQEAVREITYSLVDLMDMEYIYLGLDRDEL